MKNIQNQIEILKQFKLSTIIRTKSSEHALKIMKASITAGIKFIEVTLTTPNALGIIKEGRKQFPDAFIGAGTVLTLDEAKTAVENGAQYLVSSISNEEIATWSIENDILYLPGVLTPNEMYKMYQKGLRTFKLFPANSVPFDFIKLIKNPHPEYNFLATGGIDSTNIKQFLNAGAIACGVTADLGGADEKLSFEEILEIAKKYVAAVK